MKCGEFVWNKQQLVFNAPHRRSPQGVHFILVTMLCVCICKEASTAKFVGELSSRTIGTDDTPIKDVCLTMRCGIASGSGNAQNYSPVASCRLAVALTWHVTEFMQTLAHG